MDFIIPPGTHQTTAGDTPVSHFNVKSEFNVAALNGHPEEAFRDFLNNFIENCLKPDSNTEEAWMKLLTIVSKWSSRPSSDETAVTLFFDVLLQFSGSPRVKPYLPALIEAARLMSTRDGCQHVDVFLTNYFFKLCSVKLLPIFDTGSVALCKQNVDAALTHFDDYFCHTDQRWRMEPSVFWEKLLTNIVQHYSEPRHVGDLALFLNQLLVKIDQSQDGSIFNHADVLCAFREIGRQASRHKSSLLVEMLIDTKQNQSNINKRLQYLIALAKGGNQAAQAKLQDIEKNTPNLLAENLSLVERVVFYENAIYIDNHQKKAIELLATNRDPNVLFVLANAYFQGDQALGTESNSKKGTRYLNLLFDFIENDLPALLATQDDIDAHGLIDIAVAVANTSSGSPRADLIVKGLLTRANRLFGDSPIKKADHVWVKALCDAFKNHPQFACDLQALKLNAALLSFDIENCLNKADKNNATTVLITLIGKMVKAVQRDNLDIAKVWGEFLTSMKEWSSYQPANRGKVVDRFFWVLKDALVHAECNHVDALNHSIKEIVSNLAWPQGEKSCAEHLLNVFSSKLETSLDLAVNANDDYIVKDLSNHLFTQVDTFYNAHLDWFTSKKCANKFLCVLMEWNKNRQAGAGFNRIITIISVFQQCLHDLIVKISQAGTKEEAIFARCHFDSASDQLNPYDSKFFLACLDIYTLDSPNVKEGLFNLVNLAKARHKETQNELKKLGVKSDFIESHIPNHVERAKFYEQATCIEGNQEKAVDTLLSGVKEHNPEAAFILANAFLDGDHELGIGSSEENRTKGLVYLQIAAQNGHIQASLELGKAWASGKVYRELEQNIENAIDLLHSAEQKGNVDAFFELQKTYFEIGDKKYFRQGISWLSNLVEDTTNNCSDYLRMIGLLRLIEIYQKGDQANPKQAAKYRDLLNRLCHPSQGRLDKLLNELEKVGVKSGEQAYAVAQLFFEGYKINKNGHYWDMAKKHFEIAARIGDASIQEKAHVALAPLRLTLTPDTWNSVFSHLEPEEGQQVLSTFLNTNKSFREVTQHRRFERREKVDLDKVPFLDKYPTPWSKSTFVEYYEGLRIPVLHLEMNGVKNNRELFKELVQSVVNNNHLSEIRITNLLRGDLSRADLHFLSGLRGVEMQMKLPNGADARFSTQMNQDTSTMASITITKRH